MKTIAQIFRPSYDATNHGISSKADNLEVINPSELGENANEILADHYTQFGDFLVVVERKAYSTILKPYSIYASGIHSMFGGNFAFTSCASFQEVTGSNAPLKIHDRVEA